MRKFLCAVLALVMVVSMMGSAVFATEADHTGVYEGTHSYQPGGMPMSINYSFAMTLNADGTYSFVSSYEVSGSSYAGLDETGTYTIDSTALTVTAADGSVWTGTIADGVITMNRPVSAAMSGEGYGSSFDITMTKATTDGGSDEGGSEEEETDPVLASGTCGENLTWTVDENYVLTISGTGAMDDFKVNAAPWQEYQSSITAIAVNEGVTSIGNRAFFMASSAASISLPSTVTSIGSYCIYMCTSLETLDLSHVTAFGDYSVRGCTKLATVTLSENLTSIPSSTFYGCSGLTQLTVPAAVTGIGSYAFDSCTSLTAITFEGDAPTISKSAFNKVTATCYYPADNATWTDEVKTNYGGTLTWVEAGSGEETIDYSAYAGAYEGTHAYQPGGMPMSINYSFTMTLNADGTYSFISSYEVSGNTYAGLDETGTYTIDGTTMTVTAADGSVWTGTIEGGVITMNRPVSAAMSGEGYGSSFDITMTLGGASEEEPTEPSEPSEPEEPSEPSEPVVSGDLASGCYAVDISWSPMASMFAPILEIDAEAMTFKVYSQSAPETSKGAGAVAYADGVYTLTYENGNTTTFTYADGVITFTSRLWYGTASFNQTDDAGNFVSYTATLIVEESENADVAGDYEGTHTYQPTGMPMKLMYSFTMSLNEDGTYSFDCKYGTDETYSNAGLSETGTYTVEGSTVTITNANGDSWTGTVNADGSISMTRPLTAAMSGEGYGSAFDILLTPVSTSGGETPEETVPEETTPETTVPEATVPETTVPEETVPETTAPEETEPPKSTVISVSSLKDLEPGKYRLSAKLSCWLPAMGGCEFGGVLRYAILTVEEDGSASITLYLSGNHEITMMYGSTGACVSPSSEISYWNGEKWVDAKYTTGSATDEEGNAYTYVSSMTFPITSLEDVYKLGMGFGGSSMSAQFGGNSAQMISDGSVLEAILTIDWSQVYTNPVTGDEMPLAPFALLMLASACGIAVLLVLKKRKVF